MNNIFTQHPQSVGESYFAHFKFAFNFGLQMLIGGLACIIHAFFPFLFQKTGSELLLKIFNQFIERTPHQDERIINFLQKMEKKIKIKSHKQ